MERLGRRGDRYLPQDRQYHRRSRSALFQADRSGLAHRRSFQGAQEARLAPRDARSRARTRDGPGGSRGHGRRPDCQGRLMYTLAGKKVYVAGHRGMVGSALVRRLASEDCEILTASRDELDLMHQAAVRAWMASRRPDAVFVAAAKVGGILANDSFPADFLYDNLMIEANLIEAAHRNEVEKLLFLGSSCIYPKLTSQPIEEDALLTGPLEQTN